MLLIGGRSQQVAEQGFQPPPAPPVDDAAPPAAPSTAHDPVAREIDRAVEDYQTTLVTEYVKGTAPGVEVRTRLDGEVIGVHVAEHVPLRYGVEGMGELIVRAARAASEAAAVRREELARQVTFFGEPALARVEHMVVDPDGSAESLTAVRYW